MTQQIRINNSRRATTLLTFAALMVVSIVLATSSTQAQPVRAESPAQGTISSLLLLGFDPQALAACGGSGAHLDTLRIAAGFLTTELDAFGASDEAVRTLQAQIQEVEEARRSGGFSAAEPDSFPRFVPTCKRNNAHSIHRPPRPGRHCSIRSPKV